MGHDARGGVVVHEDVRVDPDHVVVVLELRVLEDQAFLPVRRTFLGARGGIDIVVDQDEVVAVPVGIGLHALAVEPVPHRLVVTADHHRGQRFTLGHFALSPSQPRRP